MVVDLVTGFADPQSGRHLERDAVFASMSVGKQFINVLALTMVEKIREALLRLVPGFRYLPFRLGDHAWYSALSIA